MRYRYASVLAVLMSVGFAACSGGGSPAPDLHSSPTGAGATAASQVTYPLLPTSALRALPSVADISGTLTLDGVAAPNGATVTLGASTLSPAQAGAVRPLVEGRTSVYYFVTLTASASVTFPRVPSFTLNLPSSIPVAGRSFYYAISDPTASTPTFRTEGPAAVSGSRLTFAAEGDPLVITAGKTYTFAFYASEQLGTPAPAPPVVASPASLVFSCNTLTQAGCSGHIMTISEANYSGAFEITSCNGSYDGIATAENCSPSPGFGQGALCLFPPTANGTLSIGSNANGTQLFLSASPDGNALGDYVCRLKIADDKGRSTTAAITFTTQ